MKRCHWPTDTGGCLNQALCDCDERLWALSTEEEEKHLLDRMAEEQAVGYKSPPREGQWKPGQSGNPGGRPKWKPISEALQHLVTPKVADAIASELILRAGKGDVSAFNALTDRLEGKVSQTIGGSTETGPVKLVIEWEK